LRQRAGSAGTSFGFGEADMGSGGCCGPVGIGEPHRLRHRLIRAPHVPVRLILSMRVGRALAACGADDAPRTRISRHPPHLRAGGRDAAGLTGRGQGRRTQKHSRAILGHHDMLQRTGIRRIQEAVDGAETLGCIAESRPDLVILDWELAILSGEEVIRLVRNPETSPAPTVPIVLMMAQPQKDRVERAVRLGVNEVIAKPFSPKTLWSRLDEVINRPRPYETVKSMLRPIPRQLLSAAAS
jgi:two-component system chemotaxis response regulator CheY